MQYNLGTFFSVIRNIVKSVLRLPSILIHRYEP